MNLEGSGKRQIFAIGNYVKLSILSRKGLSLLERTLNDDTLDQSHPLECIKGAKQWFWAEGIGKSEPLVASWKDRGHDGTGGKKKEKMEK